MAAQASIARTETILVVDDDLAVCRATHRILESAGYTVLIARSGPEALHLCAKHSDTAMTGGVAQQIGGTAGQMLVAMAPPSSGAKESPIVVAALAGVHPGGGSTSGIVARPTGCASGSLSGVCPNGIVDLSTSPFLPFAEGSAYALSSRVFQPATVSGASYGRVVFADGLGRQWSFVYDGSTSFTLPLPPSGFGDRTHSDETPTGSASRYQAFDSGYGASDAITWGPGNVGALGNTLNRFSSLWL
jgi:CheY-like chemotaxis protein